MTTVEALESVKNGADVYAYGLAVKLREIEREQPELIDICPPKAPPEDGAEQQPYFGCICTRAGQVYLADHKGLL